MSITQVTLRALVKEFDLCPYAWWGDIDEEAFLLRIYDLESLPSTDDRYANALQDYYQHRVNNDDWEYEWIFADERFQLGTGNDQNLLRFLAESLHPEVRFNLAEVQTLFETYNRHLGPDGWQLYPKETISGRPVFGWRRVTPTGLSPLEIRKAIAEAIAEHFKAQHVADFCRDVLGLAGPKDNNDDPMKSKRMYVMDKLMGKDDVQLREIVRKVHHETADAALAVLLAQLEIAPGGVEGHLKNLIFAANGPKPEIVLRDAINNDIEITANGEYCLVYDRPVGDGELTWRQLVEWWGAEYPGESEREVALALHRRLLESLNDGPEKLILNTYAKLYGTHGYGLPALIPQVYLHLDPLTQQQRGGPSPLPRQRMDFLLLLPKHRRVVIELDGRQHYAEDDGTASPQLYGEMMREDRALRLAGYEVFRFGGQELTNATSGDALLAEFFSRLLTSHGVRLEPSPGW